MRAVLIILIAAVIVITAGVATGFLHVSQTREAKAPQVTASRSGVSAKGGQAPAFDVETGSVSVGTKDATVKVPALEVQKAGTKAASTNNAM